MAQEVESKRCTDAQTQLKRRVATVRRARRIPQLLLEQAQRVSIHVEPSL